MKRKTKKNKRITKGKLALSVMLGFFVFMICFSYINQHNQTQEVSAQEYFEVSGVVTGGEISGDGLLLEELDFNITAIKGDAHEVWINTAGVGGTEEQDIGTMVKGKPYWIQLDFTKTDAGYYYIRSSSEGQFILKLQITSLEAWGTINIVVPPPR
jgi:hypothetical protein